MWQREEEWHQILAKRKKIKKIKKKLHFLSFY